MDMQISVPPDLKDKIEREARLRGMPLAEFVCTSLEWAISQNSSNDPLFADAAVYRDDGPVDFASNHDAHLYGDAS